MGMEHRVDAVGFTASRKTKAWGNEASEPGHKLDPTLTCLISSRTPCSEGCVCVCVRVGGSEAICTKHLMSSGPGKSKQLEGSVGHQSYSLSSFPKVYDFTLNGSGLVLQPVHDSHDK